MHTFPISPSLIQSSIVQFTPSLSTMPIHTHLVILRLQGRHHRLVLANRGEIAFLLLQWRIYRKNAGDLEAGGEQRKRWKLLRTGDGRFR